MIRLSVVLLAVVFELHTLGPYTFSKPKGWSATQDSTGALVLASGEGPEAATVMVFVGGTDTALSAAAIVDGVLADFGEAVQVTQRGQDEQGKAIVVVADYQSEDGAMRKMAIGASVDDKKGLTRVGVLLALPAHFKKLDGAVLVSKIASSLQVALEEPKPTATPKPTLKKKPEEK